MLSKQRDEINRIDKEIVKLFEERMKIVTEVARVKEENDLPILDSSREAEVYEKVVNYLDDKQLSDKLKELYTTLMRVSKDYQLEYIKKG